MVYLLFFFFFCITAVHKPIMSMSQRLIKLKYGKVCVINYFLDHSIKARFNCVAFFFLFGKLHYSRAT